VLTHASLASITSVGLIADMPHFMTAPARDSIEYQAKPFALVKSTNNFTGPYSGIPNPEIDQKWEALVKSMLKRKLKLMNG
jgi:hypothetical protein